MHAAGHGHCLSTLLWLRAVPDPVLDASPAHQDLDRHISGFRPVVWRSKQGASRLLQLVLCFGSPLRKRLPWFILLPCMLQYRSCLMFDVIDVTRFSLLLTKLRDP